MNEHQFILISRLQNTNICDDLINYFKNSSTKNEGSTIGGINYNIKKCFDVNLNKKSSEFKNYFYSIIPIFEEYKEKYFFSNFYGAWGLIDDINVQYYEKNQGYFNWHTERTTKQENSSSRHLVFMTYLNDVYEGGETEWFYQRLKIKPEKGLTVIWPTDWTFTHKGNVPISNDKYIATGWMNFIE